MPFTIPNQSAIPAQSRVFQSDIDIIAAGGAGLNGVVSGCAVTEAGSPDLSVVVATGSVVSAGVLVAITGGAVVIADPDATNPRFDLIVAVDDDSVDVLTGTPDPAPVPLSPGAGEVALAQVWVPANDTAITDGQIVDKGWPVGVPNTSTSGWTTVSATSDLVRNNTATPAADSVLKFTPAANTKYRWRAALFFTVRQASGLTLALAGPATPDYLLWGGRQQLDTVGAEAALGNKLTYTSVIVRGATGSGSTVFQYTVMLEGVVHNGANASPDLSIDWSQNFAVAENTTRRAGSFLEYSVA